MIDDSRGERRGPRLLKCPMAFTAEAGTARTARRINHDGSE
jgi:hypothetical protein